MDVDKNYKTYKAERGRQFDFVELALTAGGASTGLILTFFGDDEADAAVRAVAYARTKDPKATLSRSRLVVYPHGPNAEVAWVSAPPSQLSARSLGVATPREVRQVVWVRRGAVGGCYEVVGEPPTPSVGGPL